MAGAPGSYFYSGQIVGGTSPDSLETADAELHGAFVVDVRGTRPTTDRVMVIGLWMKKFRPAGFVNRGDALRFTINGKSWPHTERLTYSVGDTVRFRVINASIAVHPMHLHGFYFNVEQPRRRERRHTSTARRRRRRVVTERAAPGRTFSMTWVPERAGNWLFHCHDNFHVLRNSPLDGSALPPEHLAHVEQPCAGHDGRAGDGDRSARARRGSASQARETARRQLRLVTQQDAGGSDAEPAYGYVLHEGTSATPASRRCCRDRRSCSSAASR